MSQQTEAVGRFYEAFNAHDLNAFVATLSEDVELQTARGLRIGREEARAWATPNPAGGLEQKLIVEELREHTDHVVALIRKQWWWEDSDELADDEETAALFTFSDGLITRWQPFTDRDEALRAAGIGPD